MSQCKFCGESIEWREILSTGRYIPVNLSGTAHDCLRKRRGSVTLKCPRCGDWQNDKEHDCDSEPRGLITSDYAIDFRDICDIAHLYGPSKQTPVVTNCDKCGVKISFRRFEEDGFDIPFNMDCSKHYCALKCQKCGEPITFELCIPSLRNIPIDPRNGFDHKCFSRLEGKVTKS